MRKQPNENNMFYCNDLGASVKTCHDSNCYHHTCSHNTYSNRSVVIDKTRERQDKDVKQEPRFKLF